MTSATSHISRQWLRQSLAFLIPLIQRLGGRHSSTFGARALILLPTRELALQVMKVGKELARGWRDGEGGHAGDREGDEGESSKQTNEGLLRKIQLLEEELDNAEKNARETVEKCVVVFGFGVAPMARRAAIMLWDR